MESAGQEKETEELAPYVDSVRAGVIKKIFNSD